MMGVFQLSELSASLGLPRPASDAIFGAVSTDSRKLQRGSLFVALTGEHFDGHDYVAEAERRGAAAVLCSRKLNSTLPALLVPDTLLALGRLAELNRLRFQGPVIALTGSAGKTTTKEMIAAILARSGAVLATEGNLNNEIGVPLTLLQLSDAHRYAVIEMGASKAGDIRYLATLAHPDVALITNALAAHLEGFGSVAAVAAAKAEIYDALPADGTAVLNIDDAFAAQWRARIGTRRVIAVSASGNPSADVGARDIRVNEGMVRARLEVSGEAVDIALRMPGVQQVANAVMASAVAVALGLDVATIRDGLQSVQAVPGRMNVLLLDSGCRVIDDTYNANPGSVRAAIDSLATYQGVRVLVLGNMAELGADSATLHREMGAYARERGIDRLLAIGAHAQSVIGSFGTGGMLCATREVLVEACRAFDHAGVTMLVKGSRSAAMECVVAALVNDGAGVTERMGVH